MEFYAPWCGHCQNLKPAYEKAAKKLEGYAKVAAMDCDDADNKPFCGSMGVQGFPTIKTVRPGKNGGKPVVEDYNGPRTATGIVEDVLNKVNNHVTRVTSDKLDKFLEGDKPKAILFSDKGTTSALLRSIAIAYLDVIDVGQVRNKETAAVEKFGIEKFPTFVLVPGQGKDPIVYDGELNKKDMVSFLKQVGEPNPDPAPSKKKKSKSKAAKEEKKPKKQAEPEPQPEDVPESSSIHETTASPVPSFVPIPRITDADMLNKQCLERSAHTCVIAFIPTDYESEDATSVVVALSQLSTKYMTAKRHMFPFFSLPNGVSGADDLRISLGVEKDIELVVVNARRGWWRHYNGEYNTKSIEAWIDAVRMGDGAKNKLPAGVVKEPAPEPEVKAEEEAESETVEPVHGTGTEAEIETEAPEGTPDKVEDEEQPAEATQEKDEL